MVASPMHRNLPDTERLEAIEDADRGASISLCALPLRTGYASEESYYVSAANTPAVGQPIDR